MKFLAKRYVVKSMENQEVLDKAIDRAINLLAFMSEEEVAAILLNSGVENGIVFLAVKAAKILVGDT